jgi:hypothetical protein
MNYVNPSAKLALSMCKLSKYELKKILFDCNRIFEKERENNIKKIKKQNEERIREEIKYSEREIREDYERERERERNKILYDY